MLYRDGIPVATLVAGEVNLLQPMDDAQAWVARTHLLRETAAHAIEEDAEVDA